MNTQAPENTSTLEPPRKQIGIASIDVQSLLSFAHDTPRFQMNNLNILIGANGSGKSNFLEVFALLRSLSVPQRASGNLNDVIARGGGFQAWIYKPMITDAIQLHVRFFEPLTELTYLLKFTQEYGRSGLRIIDERIINDAPNSLILYDFNNGKPNLINYKLERDSIHSWRFDSNVSVLSQIKDPNNYWSMFEITSLFEQIKLYRNWSFGRDSILRQPQRADMRSSVLEEDFSNFCLFLSRLFRSPSTKQKIIEAFSQAYTGITDIQIDVGGANAELFVFEGENAIPAIRLSDGTLRYLVLVALLLDPAPPPLICLEEPELGLHPDLIGNIAKLLKDASTRTQLVITTHSELLVDAFTDQPESIVVCEKHNGATTLKRLEPEHLKVWLEDYRLGEVWLRGELGGVRW